MVPHKSTPIFRERTFSSPQERAASTVSGQRFSAAACACNGQMAIDLNARVLFSRIYNADASRPVRRNQFVDPVLTGAGRLRRLDKLALLPPPFATANGGAGEQRESATRRRGRSRDRRIRPLRLAHCVRSTPPPCIRTGEEDSCENRIAFKGRGQIPWLQSRMRLPECRQAEIRVTL
jgi:hypothetical protein